MMRKKELIAMMLRIHATDDPIITAGKAIDGLYEMDRDLDGMSTQRAAKRQIRRAIHSLQRYIQKNVDN